VDGVVAVLLLNVRVRPSVPDDAEAIAAVQVRSFRAGWADLYPAEDLDALDPAPRVPLWRERSALVALDGDEVVGVVEVGPSDEQAVGEIYRFFVDPAHWGRGVAQALLQSGVEQLRAAGFAEALLWVHAGSARARRFYEASGWRPDGAEKELDTLGRPATFVCYRFA
jgi:GNAT superfamily N-acetyltransferase